MTRHIQNAIPDFGVVVIHVFLAIEEVCQQQKHGWHHHRCGLQSFRPFPLSLVLLDSRIKFAGESTGRDNNEEEFQDK
jgi:hypothetical protein